VPPAATQAALRRAFARWGRPEAIRFDNGHPWGSAGDLPTALELWLAGLGIAAAFIPPRRPQRNGVVERSQGTAQRWAEPGACASPAELQARLREMDALQREHYPACDGRSRLAAYPGLAHSGRRYSAAWERQHWDLRRALDHLAGFAVPRRVDSAGMASVYDRGYYVGKSRAGQTLWVLLDPRRRSWVFADAAGRQVREVPAEQLTRQRIVALNLGRDGPRPGRRRYET
jgi:hypothetical protein